MSNAEEFIAAQKATLETMFGLGYKAFEGMEKLVELNIATVKTSFSEAADTTRALMAVKDPQEFAALQATLMQPVAEKAAAYSRHVYDIAAATNAEVTRAAEAQVAQAQQKFLSTIDSAMKNAPAGSENFVTLLKSGAAAANNAYETGSKAFKQAADVTEANIQAMTSTAVKAVPKARRAA